MAPPRADEIERALRTEKVSSMGMSDPEVRKKFAEPRWLQYKHELRNRAGRVGND